MPIPSFPVLALALVLGSPVRGVQEAAGAPPPDTSAGGEVLMLHLRDGATHFGSIAEHDPDGVRFRRLDSGGIVDVPWSLLDPVQEQELRSRYGYVDVSSEQLLIQAERLQLEDGREIVGVILSREDDQFLVQTDGNVQVLPKSRVRSITSGHAVPALDVYTREEIYSREAARTPRDDASAQFELAATCERILDFVHAVEHYERALELDSDLGDGEVEFALERARQKAENQEQIDYLRRVDQLRKRQQFDEALTLTAAFPETFPGSPLALDAVAKRDQVLRARDEAVRDMVVSRWRFWLGRLSREAAKQLEGHAEAVAYAEERMGADVRERVLADVRQRLTAEITPETLEEFWKSRRVVRYDVASYGIGTWLLGEEGAHAGTADEDEVAPEESVSETDRQRADLEEKIKRFLENQERARRARSDTDEGDTRAAFWSTYPVSSRAQWILAYYAEHSGDMELRPRPSLRSCPACGGRGVREIILSSGGSSAHVERCGVCQGVGVVRRVYFR